MRGESGMVRRARINDIPTISGRLLPLPGLRRFSLFLLIPLLAATAGQGGGASPESRSPVKDPAPVLRRIHDEVVSLGKRPGDAVLTWDFHIGPADDDTNQDEHVVIIVQETGAGARMTIQVTELEPAPRNPNIRYGRASRAVVCLFRTEGVEIGRNEFPEREFVPKLSSVLEAVLNKKRLLRAK
jgi:hypothetical protein